MVEAALLIFQKLTQEEKNVLKTFEKRIYALYPFKEQVGYLVGWLDLCKSDPVRRTSVEVALDTLKKQITEVFANLNFESAAEEKGTLDKFAQEKRHLYEDLFRDQTSGGLEAEQAGKKIAAILRDTEEELKAIGKAQTALEHFKEGIVLFQGMIKRERELSDKVHKLAEETMKFGTNIDIDHLMLEWRELADEIEKIVLQEKAQVYDKLQKMLEEKTWAEKLAEKYEMPRKKWLFFTAKITKRDIEKDVATLVDLPEFTHYQSLLVKHANLLTKEALDYLQGEGMKQAQKGKLAFARTTQTATHDEKTGLLRSHTFKTVAEEMIELELRQKGPLAFIFIDIDDFGQFNKKYGEDMGDKVLAKVGKIIRKNVRKSDVVGRWGGEELLVISPNSGLTVGLTIAETLREAIEKESTGAAPEPITVSIGMSLLRQDGTTFEALFKVADERMRLSKMGGKNKVTGPKLAVPASVIT